MAFHNPHVLLTVLLIVSYLSPACWGMDEKFSLFYSSCYPLIVWGKKPKRRIAPSFFWQCLAAFHNRLFSWRVRIHAHHSGITTVYVMWAQVLPTATAAVSNYRGPNLLLQNMFTRRIKFCNRCHGSWLNFYSPLFDDGSFLSFGQPKYQLKFLKLV